MYQKTLEKLGNTILNLYNEGHNCLQISEAVGSSKKTVKKVLLHFGIDYSSEYNKRQEEKKNLVIKLYYIGLSQKAICEKLNMTHKSTQDIIDNSIGRRSKSKAQLLARNSTLDENCFNDLTNAETAYWIGFLYADGHLEKKNTNISVTIQESDYNHMEKLKSFTKSSTAIKKKVQKERIYYKFQIYSEIVCNRFKKLGFDNNKSHSAIPPIELLNSRDFWRGVLDGDGCLHKHEYGFLQVHLCGTQETIKSFIYFIESNIKVSKARKSRNTTNNLHEISYYKEGEQIADLLYKDATVYLNRKYGIYQNWINNKD